MTDDPNKMMQKDREALLKLRQNLSVEADDDSVGSGLLVVHDDRHAEVQNQKEEKRRREREGHSRTMNAMQDYINGLQNQIDYHRNEARKYQEKADRAAEAIDILANGEPLELTADGKLKNTALENDLAEWEKKNGKVDRTDSAALFTALQAMESDWRELAELENQHADDLEQTQREFESEWERSEVTGDKTRVNQMIKEFNTNEVSKAALTSENNEAKQMASESFELINDDGTGIDNKGSSDVSERLGTLFASAQELEVTENFNVAAIGEIQIPTREQTQDIAVPSMQININPMG